MGGLLEIPHKLPQKIPINMGAIEAHLQERHFSGAGGAFWFANHGGWLVIVLIIPTPLAQGIEIAAKCVSANTVSGDFYDVSRQVVSHGARSAFAGEFVRIHEFLK